MIPQIWVFRIGYFLILMIPAISWLIYSHYKNSKTVETLSIFMILGLLFGIFLFSLRSAGTGTGFGYAGIVWICAFIILLFTLSLDHYDIDSMYFAIFLTLFANNLWGTELTPILYYFGLQSDVLNSTLFYIAYFINVPLFYKIINWKKLLGYFLIFVFVFTPINLILIPPSSDISFQILTVVQRFSILVVVIFSLRKPNKLATRLLSRKLAI